MKVTPARLRALGSLLIEAGLLGLVVWKRVRADAALASRVAALASRLRRL